MRALITVVHIHMLYDNFRSLFFVYRMSSVRLGNSVYGSWHFGSSRFLPRSACVSVSILISLVVRNTYAHFHKQNEASCNVL